MTCKHGTDIDEDCQGCQSDAESEAEEAALALMPEEERERLIQDCIEAQEQWFNSLTHVEQVAYLAMESQHERWLKEQEALDKLTQE